MFKISLIEGIKNIDKNKTMTYLTVILFAFLFLLQGYTYSYYSVNKMWGTRIDHETVQNYQLYELGFRGISPIGARSLFAENLELETAEYFTEIDNSEHITYVGIQDSGIQINDFKGDEKIFGNTEDWEQWPYVYCLNVTPNFFEVENYRVIEGRDFTAEDMHYVEGKPRAVLLGYKYRDVYEIGDVLETPWEQSVTKFEVIGFLAEDTTVMSRNGQQIFDLDNYIVYPEYIIPIEEWDNYSKEAVSDSINRNYNYTWGNLKIMFTEEDEAEGLVEWRKAIDNYSGFGQYMTILDTKYAMVKNQSRMESLTEFFALVTSVTMIFAVATVLISIANRVSRNMKDYAIHITVGATRGNSVWFIVVEMAIILTCSMILGLIATKWMMYYINMPFYFWRFLGVYALTSVVILALSAIVARIAMRKYDICNLIK